MKKLEDVIGLEVLSSDAKLLGTVEGVGVDTENWRVGAIKVTLAKGMEASLGVKKPLFGSARIALPSEKVDSVKDIVKMREPLAKLVSFVIDAAHLPMSAGDLINKRVVSDKGQEIGITESIYIDPEAAWRIPYLQVEVDREAFRQMKLKKGAFKKRELKFPTSLVGTVGDLVMLNTGGDELARILEHVPR